MFGSFELVKQIIFFSENSFHDNNAYTITIYVFYFTTAYL